MDKCVCSVYCIYFISLPYLNCKYKVSNECNEETKSCLNEDFITDCNNYPKMHQTEMLNFPLDTFGIEIIPESNSYSIK